MTDQAAITLAARRAAVLAAAERGLARIAQENRVRRRLRRHCLRLRSQRNAYLVVCAYTDLVEAFWDGSDLDAVEAWAKALPIKHTTRKARA